MNDVLLLISETHLSDAIGNDIATETSREVFCETMSISQSEFLAAGQMGIRPEFKFRVWAHEYNGESKVRYNGKEYDIYRTFAQHDRMELYCKEVTANGEFNSD